MLTSAVLFAVVAGVCAATWTIGLKLGAAKINPVLGSLVITGVAFLVNSIALLAMRSQGHAIVFRPEAFWLMAIAGVAAAGVDVFGLIAYERGLRVTSSLIIGGTSTALVLLVGFLALQEPVTWPRLLAIALIAAGILLLHTEGG